jgi:hypothetical protein
MDILKNEILPLFEVTQSTNLSDSQDLLIETSLNQYSLYVDLKDVYLNKSQQHTIQIDENILQYTNPLYYYEIILSGKGHHADDITINIYSKLNPDFLRVNVHDLLTYRKVALNQYKTDSELKFTHIDDQSEVVVKITMGQKLYKIPDLGLPRPDRTRGNLYVWLDLEFDSGDVTLESADSSSSSSSSGSSSDNSSSGSCDSTEEIFVIDKVIVDSNVNNQLKLMLEILNYHQNSNIVQ